MFETPEKENTPSNFKAKPRFLDRSMELGPGKEVKKQEIISVIESSHLNVYQKQEGGQQKEIKNLKSQEAFFALVARDMMLLAEKYKKSIEEVHQMFLSVSCDRASLIKLLEAKGDSKAAGVVTWNTLEDLALTNGPENVTY